MDRHKGVPTKVRNRSSDLIAVVGSDDICLRSYNIYPERVTPVVLQFRGVKVLQSMRWGIPHWRNADQHIFYARTESVKSSRNYNYWKDLRHIRRCVIPCTG